MTRHYVIISTLIKHS